MRILVSIAASLFLLAAVAGWASGDIYFWEDADGTLHFTNSETAAEKAAARKFIEAPPGGARTVAQPFPENDFVGAADPEPEDSFAPPPETPFEAESTDPANASDAFGFVEEPLSPNEAIEPPEEIAAPEEFPSAGD
jgi:hypothetical protein